MVHAQSVASPSTALTSPPCGVRPTAAAAPVGIERPSLRPALARDLCTDCGLSRSADPSVCGRACQFIRPRYAELERRVHGRERDEARVDELHFGPMVTMLRASKRERLANAQWSGIATRIAERLLETGRVDAVLATASDPEDRWRPVPVLVTQAEDMASCRGMKMGFSPVLALLERARDAGHRRIAVIGIPCQVHALRALEPELGFEELYVIGTPCSDNTTTERFHGFLELLTSEAESVTYLEFRPDYRVELRFSDGRVQRIPFLALPIAKLPDDFFPLTCKSCMDYVNCLADVTVGYLGGAGDQWLIVRNERGRALVDLVAAELECKPLTSTGRRAAAVRGFARNLARAEGGLPTRRMPGALRPLVAFLQRKLGPSGLEFARARIEMKYLEGISALRRSRPRRVRWMVPGVAWRLCSRYGVVPVASEIGRDGK